MIELSKRLAAVARQVPECAVAADIGTDHAYLPVFLIQTGTADKVLAGDLTEGPCLTAKDTVRTYNLEQRISVRKGNGLGILKPGEADVAVIAGMGGKTICSILSDGHEVLEKLNRIILQPMRDAAEVRRWLIENGWRLADEEMVCEEGHYYVIINAEKGKENVPDDFTFKVGPRLLEKKDATFKNYLQKRLADIESVLEKLENATSVEARVKFDLLLLERDKIREVLDEWN